MLSRTICPNMYNDLTQTLYEGEMEPNDRYIAIGDLVYTFLHSKHLGNEANPLGRYLFTKPISEGLTKIYQDKKEQDIEDIEEKDKDEFSFSSTTLGQSPALETTHTEYSPSDTVSETTPSPKAKDPPNRKKTDKGATTTTTVSSSSKTTASQTQSDGTSTPSIAFASPSNVDDKTPKKKPFEFFKTSPNHS